MVKASSVKAGIVAPETEGEFHLLSKDMLNRRIKVPSNFDSHKRRYFLTKYHTVKMMMSIQMSKIAQLERRKHLKATQENMRSGVMTEGQKQGGSGRQRKSN